jgi:hypothetical protein
MNVERVQETPNREPHAGKRLRFLREFFLNLLISAIVSIAWLALRELHRSGQSIWEIVIDGLGMAAMLALAMSIAGEFREK